MGLDALASTRDDITGRPIAELTGLRPRVPKTSGGVISVRNNGYSAEAERKRIRKYANQPEAYFREVVLTGLSQSAISGHDFRNQTTSTEPFIARCEFSAPHWPFIEMADDFIFFKPMLTRLIPENPFRQEYRANPLDLSMPTNEKYILAMVIPEGFEVAQLPSSIHVKMPGEAGTFTYQSQVVGPFLQLVSTISLNRTVFMPDEYGNIRQFFDFIVKKHEEAIVFRKVGG